MHYSRLAGFIIDCKGGAASELDRAVGFWSSALGMAPIERDRDLYEKLDGSQRDLAIEVQRVDHESRVHLDIESDDVDAEAARLETLGARRIEKIRTWWVMEAPTGQHFCVIRAKTDLAGAPGATRWDV